jgi:DNA-binding response OmpR family regulator
MKEFENRLKKCSILYAEDDDGIRSGYEIVLRKMCNTVYTASNGHEAYLLYNEKKPDILVTDIRMPLIDGIRLVKKIRSTDKKLRILMTTAYTDEQYTLEAIELDISRYLVKPVMLEDLRGGLYKCIKEMGDINPAVINISEELSYNIDQKTVLLKGEELPLTNLESRVFEILMSNRGRIVLYEKFEIEIWRNEYMSKETLRSHIKSIRKKIGQDLIKSSKGLGYTIDF